MVSALLDNNDSWLTSFCMRRVRVSDWRPKKRMKKRFSTSWLCGVMLLGLTADAVQAEDERPIFITMQQEPYSYLDKNGNIDGYHYTIANLILEEAGFSHKATTAPIKRMVVELTSGTADCSIAAHSPFAQENFMHVADIGYELRVGIIPRKGIDLESYEDLKGLKIGVPAGMSIGDPFDSDETLDKVQTPDYEKSARMLEVGRIDAIMGAIESVRYSAFMKANIAHEIFGKPLVTTQYPFVLICSKTLPEDGYVLALKEATQRLKARGDIDAVIRDFFSFSVSAAPDMLQDAPPATKVR
ncbi:hypothetical protein CHH27_00545 [Labrenzia sp. VG12]|nr:hypothetical protein CHH27_00545 [Labrenzia sp. VG12]